MDLSEIKELMAMMEKARAKRLCIKRGEFEIELEMGSEKICHDGGHPTVNPMRSDIGKHLEVASPAKNEEPIAVEQGIFLTSPMVGTFYATPSPDDPSFVKIGDRVEKGQVVCIIEAMKVMNEVKAEHAGVLKQVLVENGHPVEFGTKLFLIV